MAFVVREQIGERLGAEDPNFKVVEIAVLLTRRYNAYIHSEAPFLNAGPGRW